VDGIKPVHLGNVPDFIQRPLRKELLSCVRERAERMPEAPRNCRPGIKVDEVQRYFTRERRGIVGPRARRDKMDFVAAPFR